MTPLCPPGRGPALARRRGFALLLMLALLALAVLLLLGLATLTRIDTAIAGQAQQAAQARRHALLALQLAVGRLQGAAGPDRRVTARADLLPAATGNPGWTGVWDGAASPPALLTWLVSGNEEDPLAGSPAAAPVADPAPGNGSVWLLRAPVGATDQRIKLAPRPLRAADLPGSAGPRLTGHYAWWVGDEGVKAKYNLVNPAAGAAPGTPENQRQFLSAQQAGLETFGPAFAGYAAAKGDSAAGAALRDRLGRVLAPAQIPYADPGVGLAAWHDRWPDFTTWARGVLSDARAGGLKRDLTRGLEAGATEPAGPVFAGGPDWELVRSWQQLQPSPADAGGEVAPRAHAPPQHGAHPLVVLVQVGWGGDRVDGHFRLLLRPMIVLANPYDAALAPADYRLVWRQSGAIELRNPPAGDEVATAGGVPSELLGEDPQFLIPQAGFAPGEARVFTLPGAGGVPCAPGAGLTLAAGWRGGGFGFRALAAPAHPDAVDLRVRVAAGDAGFELSLANGARLQTVSGAAANAPDLTGPMPLLAAPVRAGLRMGQDDANAPGDASGLRWLADFNLRAPVVGSLPAWGRNPLYNGATPRDGDDNTVLDDRDSCWGPAPRAADGGQRFVTLFHLPRAGLHSLGQLQHANLQPAAAGPAYTAGQGYADPHTPDGTADFNFRLNEALWDHFFFSTVPADATTPLNRRLVPWSDEAGPPAADALHDYSAAAAHLLVDGAFNVNSTSVAAWQAQLASLNGQRLAYLDPAAGTTVTTTVGNALPRSPFPGGGAADGWRGYRELSAAEVATLAAAIVERVRAHGPFGTLAEFVNRPLTAPTEAARRSGLLQAALDATVNPPPSLAPAAGLPAQAGPSPALAWPAASAGHRATLAPGWLSQADVLGVLGPVLAVRSDTFLVRAYGDAVDPATGAVTARAWCEAVVQRTPAYVDPADPPAAATGLAAANATYGRRFEIVAFRWLAPEEI